MAKFTDLPNELVIAIASSLRKPADTLQLCYAERRCHGLTQPLLYENIALNDYNPTHESAYQTHTPSSKIRLLCRSLKEQSLKEQEQQNSRRNRDGPSLGRRCRSLAINTNERLTYSAFDAIGVCDFVPFLRSFTLISSPRLPNPSKDTKFAIDAVGRQLRPLRHTLEALTLFISNQDYCWAAEGIGSLHSFEAMKKLRIQSQVLLGEDGALPDSSAPTLLLSEILPPNLEDLTIHCCDHDCRHPNEEGDVAHHVEAPLDGKPFATRTFEPEERLTGTDRRIIESVVVCLLDVRLWRVPLSIPLRLEKSFDIVGGKVGVAGVE